MVENFYNSDEISLFLDYELKLSFSKNFRRLNGKTQLFSSQKGDHYRNRLIHSEEVRNIALRIANLINKDVCANVLDYNLISCIALSHDFGHTPFGHVGERTLQDILSKKDKLGDIFGNSNFNETFFKHNVNSMRILVEEFKGEIPWQILDGVLKHSKLSYTASVNHNFSYLLAGTKYDNIYYKYRDTSNPLTLEGQVVAIADEIAQRYSDFEDTFRAKNINSLKKILKKMNKDDFSEIECTKYIDSIVNKLIKSVVRKSVSNIKDLNVESVECLLDTLSKETLISFDPEGEVLNDILESFIKDCIFNIDELRQEDERNKHIIRQLFKAYYNDCFQIKGQFFDKFIQNIYEFVKKIDLDINEKGYILDKYTDVFNNDFYDLDKKEVKIKQFKNFIISLKLFENETKKIDAVGKVYLKYIEQICFYISSMTDKYAINSYQYLYGIK